MFEKIESLILLRISVSFSRDIYGFKIKLNLDEKEEIVVLPYSHLTEHKIIKYIDFMRIKILEDIVDNPGVLQ